MDEMNEYRIFQMIYPGAIMYQVERFDNDDWAIDSYWFDYEAAMAHVFGSGVLREYLSDNSIQAMRNRHDQHR